MLVTYLVLLGSFVVFMIAKYCHRFEHDVSWEKTAEKTEILIELGDKRNAIDSKVKRFTSEASN